MDNIKFDESIEQLPKLYWKLKQWGEYNKRKDEEVKDHQKKDNRNINNNDNKNNNICNLSRNCIKVKRLKGFVKIDSLHRKLCEKENDNHFNQHLKSTQVNSVIVIKSGIKLERTKQIENINRSNFQKSVVYRL